MPSETITRRTLLAAVGAAPFSGLLRAQENSGVRARALVNSAVKSQQKRVQGQTTGAGSSIKPTDSLVGVTVWRLRPASAQELGVRILVHDPEGASEMIAERVPPEDPVAEGQRIRISIESGQSGYLYLVSQERYSDGSSGAPYLIFPTTRIRSGDNKVYPGKLIEVPDYNDRPNFLRVRKSRSDHIGEMVTVLVTPRPIQGLNVTNQAQRLNADTFADWRKRWGTKSRIIPTDESAKYLTSAEHAAGTNAGDLGGDDPMPSMLYVADASKGTAFLVDMQLKLAK